jgi:hypothetical protein
MLVIIARVELRVGVKRSTIFVDAYIGKYLEHCSLLTMDHLAKTCLIDAGCSLAQPIYASTVN